MSRKLLAFLLSELTTVRIVCQSKQQGVSCGAIIEVTVDQILLRQGLCCPICANFFKAAIANVPGHQDYLTMFAGAVKGLQASGLEIEFVTPAKNPPPGP